ncbi:MAG: ion channel [Janthinobacterium lividum]
MIRPSAPLPTQDPGLGEKFTARTQRMVNRDGTFNVRRLGPAWVRGDWYHYWVSLSWRRFGAAVLGYFTVINALFALGYMAIGYQAGLLGAPQAAGWGEQFLDTFFFSVQTFTSVGYGVVSPKGIASGFLSSFEALAGVLTFAVVTGLVYARFAKPTARIAFSDAAIITPPDPHTGLRRFMLRVANERSNTIIDMNVRMMLSVMLPDFTRRYYMLELERSTVMFFPLNWTLVHDITPESPLYELTADDLAHQNAEFIVLLRGFDDTFAQDINARCSYTYHELRWNHRFVRPYRTTATGETLLGMSLLSSTEVAV